MLLPLSLGLVAWLWAASSAAQGSWYAERVMTGDSPVRVEHLWAKGGVFRAETVFAGHPILTLVKGNRYVIIDRLTRVGLAIERNPAAVTEDAVRQRPFGDELEWVLKGGGEKVRSEDVGGQECDVYRMTDERGRREVCVSQDAVQLPVVERIWNRKTGGRSETRYLAWTQDLAIDDQFFEADPRVVLEHYTYEGYLEAISKGAVGPAPPFHLRLLHGGARLGL